jgi:hypothetical protein
VLGFVSGSLTPEQGRADREAARSRHVTGHRETRHHRRNESCAAAHSVTALCHARMHRSRHSSRGRGENGERCNTPATSSRRRERRHRLYVARESCAHTAALGPGLVGIAHVGVSLMLGNVVRREHLESPVVEAAVSRAVATDLPSALYRDTRLRGLLHERLGLPTKVR